MRFFTHSPVLLLAFMFSGLVEPVRATEVGTPSDFLGRELGADFTLADWGEVSGYFRQLAGQSGRVKLEKVGTTTEGRDFLLAAIGSERNLARLAELRELSRRVADPRGLSRAEKEQVLTKAVPFVFVSCAMHATETAAPQFAMELAYRLATDAQGAFAEARENVVVLLAPSLNPDGLDHVVSWYRETVGTPHEATGLLKLYQYYTGHDNNRDWFGLTQEETRIVTRLLYSEWHPQIYWDVHQQGGSRERFFVPPYRDPLNPNLDAGIITGIGSLGSRALFDMTAEGLTGIATGVTYDMWWNGGNRNVPVRHNIIGILTEAASVKIASPVFLSPDELQAPRSLDAYQPSNRFPKPWPGGWWRLRDIIDYELAFARSLLGGVAREPQTWLGNAMAAADRSLASKGLDGARAWLIPADNPDRGAVRRLVDTLLLGGVEVHAAEESFVTDSRTWPKGSLVIPLHQPYGNHVQDLFEVQRYPAGAPPYDVAGWTLPMLFGVRRVAVMEEPGVSTSRVLTAEAAIEGFPGRERGRLLDSRDSDSWDTAWSAIRKGDVVSLGIKGQDASWLSLGSPRSDASWLKLRQSPRIGLYAPWRGSKDEGWARWVFDTHGVPHLRVRNEMLRAGQLADLLDVLVIPDISGRALDRGRNPGSVAPEYSRGLDPEGAVAIEEFVRSGGTLVVLGASANWAVDLFEFPLVDVTRTEGAGFSCPGSVLRGIPTEDELVAGMPESVSLFFSRGSAWSLPGIRKAEPEDHGSTTASSTGAGAGASKLRVLMRYAPTRVLRSGWIAKPEVIEGQAAWVLAEHGKGQVHLFGFRPQYRGWSQDSFELLYRALLVP